MNVSTRIGSYFNIKGIPFQVKQYHQQFQRYTLESEEGERVMNMDEVYNLFKAGELTFSQSWDSAKDQSNQKMIDVWLTPSEIEVVNYRLGYVKAAMNSDGTWNSNKSEVFMALSEHGNQFGDSQLPAIATVRRWYQRFSSHRGDLHSLRPHTARRGNRKSKLDPIVWQTIKNVIYTYYLTTDRRTLKEVRQRYFNPLFLHSPELVGKELPSYKTFCKYAASIGAYDKAKARYGERKARQMFPTGRPVSHATAPLEHVELDHTPIDITLVDVDGKTLKRVYVTFIIDRYSRMILGFYVSMQPVNRMNVIGAITHAVMPKTYMKKKYPNLKTEWPCLGIFSLLTTDNGSELHSEAVRLAAHKLQFDVEYLPPGSPNLKGQVERFIKTFNYSLIHQLPGTTFANYTHGNGAKSYKDACITFEVLIELIHRWIVDDYHVSIHRTLGDSPLNVWMSKANTFTAPRMPSSIHELSSLYWERKQRSVQKYGIDLFGNKYNSEALMNIAKKIGFGKKVEINYDPRNISCVYVMEAGSSRFEEVHSTNPAYVETEISLREHIVIRKRLRRKQGVYVALTDEMLTQGRHELRLDIESQKAKKNATRKSRRHAADTEMQKTSASVTGTENAKTIEIPRVIDDVLPKGYIFKPEAIEVQYD